MNPDVNTHSIRNRYHTRPDTPGQITNAQLRALAACPITIDGIGLREARTLHVLERVGLAQRTDTGWDVTPRGTDALRRHSPAVMRV